MGLTLVASTVSADFWHDITAPVRGTGRLLSGESDDEYNDRKIAKEERKREENLAKEARLKQRESMMIKRGMDPRD